MRPDRGAVDHLQHIELAAAIRQRLQQQVPDTGFTPAAKLPPNRIPVAQLRRQVAPRRTGPQDPEYPVQGAAMILRWASASGGWSGQERRENRPVCVRHQASDHCRPPLPEVALESHRSASGESLSAKTTQSESRVTQCDSFRHARRPLSMLLFHPPDGADRVTSGQDSAIPQNVVPNWSGTSRHRFVHRA